MSIFANASSNFQFNGNASALTSNVMQLTADTTSQAGTAMLKTKVDLTQSLNISFSLYFGNHDSGGADGLGFILHNDPRGISAIGDCGGTVGFGSSTQYVAPIITNSIAIRWLTYTDMGAPQYTQIDQPVHFANDWNTNTNGENTGTITGGSAVELSNTPYNYNLKNGASYPVRLAWDPATTTLTHYFNGLLMHSCNLGASYATDYFGGSSNVYLGFGGGTGGATNQQTVTLAPLDMNGTTQTITETNFPFHVISSTGTPDLTINLQNNDETVFAGIFSPVRNVTKTGSYTVTLNGTNTYTGTTTISQGKLIGDIHNSSQVEVDGTYDLNGTPRTVTDLSGTGTVQSSNGSAALTVNSVNGSTFNGIIASTITNLTINGSETFNMLGTNNSTGTTTINGGTFVGNASQSITLVTSSSAYYLGTQNQTLGTINDIAGSVIGLQQAATTTTARTLTLNNTAPITINSNIIGTGNLVINGTSSVTLTGANTYTGSTTVNSGTLNIQSSNNLGTVLLNGGTLGLGGGGTTTNITTLDWNGGNIDVLYSSGSFGNTHINNLNITTPTTVTLSDTNGGVDLASITNSKTLFTFDNITGDPSQITLVNTHSLIEVTGESGSSGITYNGNSATINIASAASAHNPADVETVQSPTDIPMTIATTEVASQFAPTPYQNAEAGTRIQKALQQQRGGDPFENLVTALSEGGDTTKFVKIKGKYRVFAAPYTTVTRNNGSGNSLNGSSSKYYGMIMGLTHYVKSIDTNFFFTLVAGASKTQMSRSVNSCTNGKNATLGVNARKTFIKHLDVDSGLNLTIVKSNQWRQGNPTPATGYVAKSNFNTYAASWRNETGYIFELPNKQSIKPDIGLQLNHTQQTKINEQDAGIYAQNFKSKTTQNGELYGGIGYRAEWKDEQYEGKLTLKYEIGRKSGNGKIKTTVYTASTPDGFTSTSTGSDLVTHYIGLYGSILDKKSNWKIVPGIMVNLQRHQKSGTAMIKFERRF
ncbi:MAG: autotransporter-associated beta strand repeat-containing protein [Pseudomonadota bacterium]